MYLSWHDPAMPDRRTPTDHRQTEHQRIIDTCFYTHQFGPDGTLYLGTQSTNRLPKKIGLSMQLNELPTGNRKGAVGKNEIRLSLRTIVMIAPDTNTVEKWIYVCVGKNPWKLAALNLSRAR